MMELVITLAALLCVPFIAGLALERFRFLQGQLITKPNRAYFDQKQVRAGVECAARCFGYGVDTCSIAQYRISNRTCSLFYWKDVGVVKMSDVAIDINTTILYISPGRKHIYLSSVQPYYEGHARNLYTFSFAEAMTNCALIGGTLGTPTDVTTSRDDGWEICACGWTVDGRAYYHVTVLSEGCNRTNRHRCAIRPVFGAHCLFY